MAGTGSPSVLLLVKGLGLGGAERLIVEQALAPTSVRYQAAFVRPDKDHFVAALEAGGVPVTGLRAGRAPWPIALARLLRATRPDVVHAHSPLPAAAARVLVRLGVAGRGTAVVSTEHNRWSAYRLPTRVVNAATMPLDHRTWAVSDEARASVRPGWLRRRVVALRHGIDLEAVRRRASEAPDSPLPDVAGAFVVVHVANRRPEKAHDVLLAAFAIASARDPGLHLWLVGQHLDAPDLTALIEATPNRDRLAVLGYRQDAPAIIGRADVLVLSSDHEGLPVAVMEAMALGRPVVSTAVGGVPEAVRDDVEGVLVPPRDPEALATALVDLHLDPERRARLALGASERAAIFDGSAAHRTQEQAYAELVARRR